MDSLSTTILIASGLILGCFFTARLIAAMRLNRPPSMSVFGDFPHVPSELRGAVKRTPGGGAAKTAPAQTQTSLDRTHRGSSVTK